MDKRSSEPVGEYTLADHVRCVTNADYGMLLNLETGKFHGLNRLGADLIRAVREGQALGTWGRATAERYGMPADVVDGDVARFVDRLVGLGMLLPRRKEQ